MKIKLNYFFGYFVGITLFLIIIPYGIYEFTEFSKSLTYLILFHNTVIRCIISALFLLVGMYYMVWSNIFLLKVGKGTPAKVFGVSLSPQTKKLITVGLYRHSRNPMVFGAFCIYTSIILYFNSLIGLISLLIFLFFAIIYLKLSEEKRLLKDFGEEFIEYRKKVSMIIPIRKLRK